MSKVISRGIGLGIGLLLIMQSAFGQLRDPTAPQVETDSGRVGMAAAGPKEAQALVLSAIFISGAKHTAVINDKLVSEGDKIGGKVVKEIGPYSVKLVGETGEVVLYLFGPPIKGEMK